MKTNVKQQEILDIIKTELSFWENTNDISSPSHHSSMDNMFNMLESTVYEEDIDGIQEGLTTILYHIRKIK